MVASGAQRDHAKRPSPRIIAILNRAPFERAASIADHDERRSSFGDNAIKYGGGPAVRIVPKTSTEPSLEGSRFELLVPQFSSCRARPAFLTDQRTTEQGVGRIPAYPALSSRPPAESNSVTSGPAEIDPVLHTPLPQSRFLGLVRKIVPPFESARRTSKSLNRR